VGSEIFVPSPLFATGVCFVDTPGLGSVIRNNTAATRALMSVLIQIASATIHTEHGQMLCVTLACGRFCGGFSYRPFRTENWLYSVERIEAGETADGKSTHAVLTLTV